VVTRWLLADGVSVGHLGPVLEGVARVLAAGNTSSAALIEGARKQLGGAVIGHAPFEHPLDVLHLDPAATESAAASKSVEPVLRAHSEMLTTTRTTLVLCQQEHRAAVSELLRPLVDVLRVATHAEIADTVIRLPQVVGV
jgi:flagellar biosynthesis component FlhA